MKKRVLPIILTVSAILLMGIASSCSATDGSTNNSVDYSTSISTLKTDLANLTQSVQGLTTSVSSLTGSVADIATIKSALSTIQSAITTLQNNISGFNNSDKEINTALAEIIANYETLSAYVNSLETSSLPIIYIKPILNSAGLTLALFSNVERTGSFEITLYQTSPAIISGATSYDEAFNSVMSSLPFNVTAGVGIVPQPIIIKSGTNYLLYGIKYVTPITTVAKGDSSKILGINTISSNWYVVVDFKSAAMLGGSSGW